MDAGQALARGLGVFSLGLGLYQVMAPREFAQAVGVRPRPDREALARALGVRELGAAAGLLTSRMPVSWMWMRVAGDVMDVAILGRAMADRDTRHDRAGTAMASVLGIAALDVVGSVLVSREAQRQNGHGDRSGNGRSAASRRSGPAGPIGTLVDTLTGGDRLVVKSITIERPRSDVYAYWRDFTNLPSFMHHLESVVALDADGRRSHWRARAPLGMTVEWDAEMTEDVPDERIAWRSAEGAQIRNEGVVEFRDAPRGDGTIVRVELQYDPPAGPLGVAIAKLTGEEPDTQTSADLRRFKQVLETGEVVVSDATIGGRRLRQRPAQPQPPEAAKA